MSEVHEVALSLFGYDYESSHNAQASPSLPYEAGQVGYGEVVLSGSRRRFWTYSELSLGFGLSALSLGIGHLTLNAGFTRTELGFAFMLV